MSKTKEQLDKLEVLSDLQYFHCTTEYHLHKTSNGSRINITDGCNFLRDKAECYWLFDIILIAQSTKLVKSEPFQVWTLNHQKDNSWMVEATDGNETILYKQRLAFSDFPLDGITLYVSEAVILLPSEY